MKTKVHFQSIIEALNGFEEEYVDKLVQMKFKGWSDWSILKKPLFYLFKNRSYGLGRPPGAKRKSIPLSWAFKEVWYLTRLFFWILWRRKGDVIYGNTGNKLDKDKDGFYTDVFMDPLINAGLLHRYIFFEDNSETGAERPSKVKIHLYHRGRNGIVIILQRMYVRRKDVQERAAWWSSKLNQFFEENDEPMRITQKEVAEIFSQFLAQYRWNKFMLQLNRPRRVFFVDGIPLGRMAAARSLGIEVHEFQHGFVSNNKADYIVAGAFRACKQHMVIPNHIYVFGDYFRDLLLKSGFWDKSEVISIGSSVVERNRQSYQYKPAAAGEKLKVLWITQPTIFENTKTWLNQMPMSELDGIEISLKTHPLEPSANLEWYKEFVEKNAVHFALEAEPNLFSALRNKHVLIGFHSTALLEAISVGVPVATVCTPQFPHGINSLLDMDASEVMKPIESVHDLLALLAKLKSAPDHCHVWSKESYELGDYFFSEHYQRNLEKYFSKKGVNDNYH